MVLLYHIVTVKTYAIIIVYLSKIYTYLVLHNMNENTPGLQIRAWKVFITHLFINSVNKPTLDITHSSDIKFLGGN